jgi:glycosyltransferase involved in cell wall biosynthesis
VFFGASIQSDVVPTSSTSSASGRAPSALRGSLNILVPRNLEPIYDVATALHALQILRSALPQVRMTVAGSGPERARLERLASELGCRRRRRVLWARRA